MVKKSRFQNPPPADPIAAVRDSSLVFRLNTGFFLRQLGIFLVMDLLLVEEEGLTVIDFKSDRIAPGTEAQAALRHKLQVDIYAQAAQKIFGLPVREKLVFFLRTGRGQPV